VHKEEVNDSSLADATAASSGSDSTSNQGFVCQGPVFPLGCGAIFAIHSTALSVILWRVPIPGDIWPWVWSAAGSIVGFWLLFAITARWLSARGTVNLIGIGFLIAFWPVVVIGAIWWLVTL
jgi:hypothetical protein